jgi:hypothetical protein
LEEFKEMTLNKLTLVTNILTATGWAMAGKIASELMAKDPLIGIGSGIGVGILATAIDAFLKNEMPSLTHRTFDRILLSNVFAGSIVYAINALAAAVGITAVAISLPEIVAITATTIALRMITEFGSEVFRTIYTTKNRAPAP